MAKLKDLVLVPYSEYYVIRSEDIVQLGMAVNSALLKGWIPQGGIALGMYSLRDRAATNEFYQAMVKPVIRETQEQPE